MRLDDFDYALPPELVAQQPASPRDASRLLVLDRATGRITHRIFREIGEFLREGDVLVLNDTRVLPARLRGRRATGGGVEVLLIRPGPGLAWEALVRPGHRIRPGTVVEVGDERIPVEIGERLPDGHRLVRPAAGAPEGSAMTMEDLMRRVGEVPLPPYIHRPLDDPQAYQTVYARADGAVAAPTAGLHFTPTLLERLRAQGVSTLMLTLHVGPGTFMPVRSDEIGAHRMACERFVITPEVAAAINGRRGRLVAVGTTVVRALESAVQADGRITAADGETDLFITPGFVFRATEALITNFHLPRTTLLMLVSAFAGRETILRAYAEAIRERYRFYSFGDAMLIV